MTRGPFLIDTGFLVALVNQADPDHAECVAAWREVTGPFLTTEGVLVEVAHLLRKRAGGLRVVTSLLRSVGCVIASATRPRLDRAVDLMERYSDVPMDFVDATLVALAEEAGVLQVLTLDRRGFLTYRAGRAAFRVWPREH